MDWISGMAPDEMAIHVSIAEIYMLVQQQGISFQPPQQTQQPRTNPPSLT
jgi:hypothetical protein